jgi:transposase
MPRGKRIDHGTRARIRAAYRAGKKLREIAAEFGIPIGTVPKIVAEGDLPRRQGKVLQQEPQLRELLVQGLPHDLIGDRLGLSKYTVCRWAVANGFRRQARPAREEVAA